jgi:hypothetical protein
MRFTFVQPASFAADWKGLGLTDEDLRALENLILDRPNAGAVMRGTGGIRKMRFAPPSWNTGKSGATRVCYIVFAEVAAVYWLAIFAKSEKANLTLAERNLFRRWVEFLRSKIKEEQERDR